MILEVYDLESLSNLFTYTGYRSKIDTWYQYVICKWRCDAKILYEHLIKEKFAQCGFNNLAYDYPLLHHFLRHWKGEYEYSYGQELAQALYAKSQYLIEEKFTEVKSPIIPQIDLYKIWHYNNKARTQNLKGLEIQMRMENVEEMPIYHLHWCQKGDEEIILKYNKWDVYATYKFLLVTLGQTDYPLYKGKNKLQLRNDLNKKFHVNVTNMGDVPMGEELMLQLYSRETGQNSYYLKKAGGTKRDLVCLKDCIPFWCKLKTKEFNTFLNQIKNTCVTGEKGEFEFSVIYHGAKFDFGLGGTHQSINPGVYEATNGWIILDLDVSSLYPSIANSLQLYPEQLGPQFMQQYSGFIKKRIIEKHKPKDERDNVLIEGYKLVLNGVYGKSKEEKSFLYDMLYTFKTTIAGQLFISMWVERMVEAVPEIIFLQTNTDGITVKIPEQKLETIRQVNNKLTEETTLVIEEAFYNKMCIRDVNNYIAVYTDSTPEHEHIKLKGDFEVDKEYHKDPSMRIVPLAVKNYFVYGIPVEETIKKDRDIFNFCMQLKTNSSSNAFFRHLVDGKLVDEKLYRMTRYLITKGKKSGILLKKFQDGRITGVNVGYSATLFNKAYHLDNWDDYNLDYQFYITEANKLKNPLIMKELDLFG